jgi:hypothetical protein
LALGQVAILQIQVIEGEGAVHAPGARNQRPLTVELTDETGRPVPAAAVTFTFPEDGPGGVFANGLHTEVVTTDAQGRASVRSYTTNRTPGRFQIRITASKEQARSGAVSFQYIYGGKGAAPTTEVAAGTRRPAEPQAAPVATSRPSPGEVKAKSNHRWLVILLVAGAAAGGATAGLSGGKSGGGSAVAAVGPAPVVTNPISIGTPGIIVGAPK